MNADSRGGTPRSALSSLRRFVRPRVVVERCELCSVELAADHNHLVELTDRRLVCACDACAILFDSPPSPSPLPPRGGEGRVRGQTGKYRRVPRRAELLPDFRLADTLWQGLGLPINLAFFLDSTAAGRVVALYPSPAGSTEAAVPPDAWSLLVEDNPVLRGLEPDVEALLVNRLGPEPEYYRVGIDQCYHLVGLVRTHWRGLTGGTEIWKEMGRFFASLKAGSHPAGDPTHA